MNIIKVLSHLSWESDQNSLITIYKSLIISIINYGSTIYNSAKKSTLNSLNSIHNQGILLSTGAFRTSPIDSILCNAGEPPLKIIRNMNIAKYIIQTKNLPNHISISNFHDNFQTITSNTPTTIFENFKNIKEETDTDISLINKIPFPSSAPWLWMPDINTTLLEYNKNSKVASAIRSYFYELTDKHYSEYTHIYTDASKNTNGTGF